MQNFNELELPIELKNALNKINFLTPTPIQAKSIPHALLGRDILGSAQTGTGKTGAFGIPLIAKLLSCPDSSALILTPTRELATQIVSMINLFINGNNAIKTALLIGGEPIGKQFDQLKRSPRIIIGTPGRINDHLKRKTLNLQKTNFLILDETDRMLDMGFEIQLETILQMLPKERQTLMFSATLPNNIIKLSNKYLNNPEQIFITTHATAPVNITQETINTTEAAKFDNLMLQLEGKTASVIIFVKTKRSADNIAKKLTLEEYSAVAIHGDLRQNKRDRVIQGFRKSKYQIMVATDLAARGLDIPHIEYVINYDLPQCPEDYIHRIGRTARAGAKGIAINLITSADMKNWKAIDRLMTTNETTSPSERRAQNSRSFSSNRDTGRFNDNRGQGRPGGDRRQGGFGGERSGGDRRQGGFGGERSGGDRRQGGFGGERPAGDRRQGGFGGERPGGNRRQGGFGGERSGGDRRPGGFGGENRFGGDNRAQGGFGGERSGGDNRGQGRYQGDNRSGGFENGNKAKVTFRKKVIA